MEAGELKLGVIIEYPAFGAFTDGYQTEQPD